MSATAEAFGIIFALLVLGAVIWALVVGYKEHKQSKRTSTLTASLPDNELQSIAHRLDRSNTPRDMGIRNWVNTFLKNSTPGARELAGLEIGKSLAQGVDRLPSNLQDPIAAAGYYRTKYERQG